MKITEARLKQNVSAANANSKHTGLGLSYIKTSGGHSLALVHRANSFPVTTWNELSASECQAAISMFNYTATATKPTEEG